MTARRILLSPAESRGLLALHRAGRRSFRALRCCRSEFREHREWRKVLPVEERARLRLIGAQCLADERRARSANNRERMR